MNKMKLTALILAACMILSVLAGCGGSKPAASAAPAPAPAPAPAAPASSAAPAASEAPAASSYSYPQTASDKPIYAVGELPKITGPVLVTSAGQTADTSTVGTILQRSGVDHTINTTASASDVAAAKTIFVAVGASMKGLGAAGVSVEQELVRAKEALAAAADDAVIIACHVGGDARRGETSDPFVELVIPMSDALIAIEGGNFDGLLTKLAEEAGIPYTMFFSLKDGMTVVGGMKA